MPEAHVVAVIGGACAGSTAANILAEAGFQVVVFEQNPKPYGKVEDGLPRWHNIQRRKEYEKIDARLVHPNISFVPNTKLGTDISFDEMYNDGGFSAILLGNGAWNDRPVDVEGIDEYIGKGLIYQNPFIYWYNHKNEKNYDGPRYEVPENTAIFGGGLSSIDVMKAVQIETYERALKANGVECTMYDLEHKGITHFCEERDIDPDSLGVKDCTIYYRRRKFDMPMAQQKDKSEEAKAKVEATRAKILDMAQAKFRFIFNERHLAKEMIIEDDRLVGLIMKRTRVDGRKAFPLEGTELEVRHPLFISSIGSIPEPIEGLEMTGAFYKFDDWDLGIYGPKENVFGVGNAVTGQGNIAISVRHAKTVAKHIMGEFEQKEPFPESKVHELLDRVKARQADVGYEGDYKVWIAKVIPSDLE
jgi:NADPH-dependent glutamate synthase beta subunit-like oxidoreductase